MTAIRCVVQVTLVPLDSAQPSAGPFACAWFSAQPQTFYYTTADGEAQPPIDMRLTPYAAVGEPVTTESRIECITTNAGAPVPEEYHGPLDEVVAFGATVHLEAMSSSDHLNFMLIDKIIISF